ncbi:hypothetical protein BC832DRAFT_101318 [Gaertneriomyces semiglobifer]|nr:hypothetical protein BC832DRAFT_101318 [Gaertneriomyces semiglobifer]
MDTPWQKWAPQYRPQVSTGGTSLRSALSYWGGTWKTESKAPNIQYEADGTEQANTRPGSVSTIVQSNVTEETPATISHISTHVGAAFTQLEDAKLQEDRAMDFAEDDEIEDDEPVLMIKRVTGHGIGSVKRLIEVPKPHAYTVAGSVGSSNLGQGSVETSSHAEAGRVGALAPSVRSSNPDEVLVFPSLSRPRTRHSDGSQSASSLGSGALFDSFDALSRMSTREDTTSHSHEQWHATLSSMEATKAAKISRKWVPNAVSGCVDPNSEDAHLDESQHPVTSGGSGSLADDREIAGTRKPSSASRALHATRRPQSASFFSRSGHVKVSRPSFSAGPRRLTQNLPPLPSGNPRVAWGDVDDTRNMWNHSREPSINMEEVNNAEVFGSYRDSEDTGAYSATKAGFNSTSSVSGASAAVENGLSGKSRSLVSPPSSVDFRQSLPQASGVLEDQTLDSTGTIECDTKQHTFTLAEIGNFNKPLTRPTSSAFEARMPIPVGEAPISDAQCTLDFRDEGRNCINDAQGVALSVDDLESPAYNIVEISASEDRKVTARALPASVRKSSLPMSSASSPKPSSGKVSSRSSSADPMGSAAYQYYALLAEIAQRKSKQRSNVPVFDVNIADGSRNIVYPGRFLFASDELDMDESASNLMLYAPASGFSHQCGHRGCTARPKSGRRRRRPLSTKCPTRPIGVRVSSAFRKIPPSRQSSYIGQSASYQRDGQNRSPRHAFTGDGARHKDIGVVYIEPELNNLRVAYSSPTPEERPQDLDVRVPSSILRTPTCSSSSKTPQRLPMKKLRFCDPPSRETGAVLGRNEVTPNSREQRVHRLGQLDIEDEQDRISGEVDGKQNNLEREGDYRGILDELPQSQHRLRFSGSVAHRSESTVNSLSIRTMSFQSLQPPAEIQPRYIAHQSEHINAVHDFSQSVNGPRLTIVSARSTDEGDITIRPLSRHGASDDLQGHPDWPRSAVVPGDMPVRSPAMVQSTEPLADDSVPMLVLPDRPDPQSLWLTTPKTDQPARISSSGKPLKSARKSKTTLSANSRVSQTSAKTKPRADFELKFKNGTPGWITFMLKHVKLVDLAILKIQRRWRVAFWRSRFVKAVLAAKVIQRRYRIHRVRNAFNSCIDAQKGRRNEMLPLFMRQLKILSSEVAYTSVEVLPGKGCCARSDLAPVRHAWKKVVSVTHRIFDKALFVCTDETVRMWLYFSIISAKVPRKYLAKHPAMISYIGGAGGLDVKMNISAFYGPGFQRLQVENIVQPFAEKLPKLFTNTGDGSNI